MSITLGPIHGFKHTLKTTSVEVERVYNEGLDDEYVDYTTRELSQIRMWCLDENDQPLLVKYDFTPFFMVQLPTMLRINGRLVTKNYWDDNEIREVVKTLRGIAPIKSWSYEDLQKLYYYNGDRTFPMIMVVFDNEQEKNRLAYHLQENEISFFSGNYSGRFTPHMYAIDTITKMLSMTVNNDSVPKETQDKDNFTGLGYCQWHTVEATEVPKHEKISIYPEYKANWRHINPLTDEKYRTKLSHPRIAAYDIETYSTNENRMPDKYAVEDVCWVITVVSQEYMRPETMVKYALVLGDCPDIEGSIVTRYTDELDLIRGWEQLIAKIDPQVIMGHNVFQYDNVYLETRLGNVAQDWSTTMSAVPTEAPVVNRITWKSNAYGYIENHIIDIPGRIWVDTLPLIKRNFKLARYNLETICQHFLKKGKDDVSAKDMFRSYKKMKALWEKAYELIQDHEHKRVVFQDPKGDQILIRDVFAQHAPELLEEWDAAMVKVEEVVRYGIQDSALIPTLFDKINGWAALIQQANVLSVGIEAIFTRGQQVKVMSQIYRLAWKACTVVDKQPPSDYPFYGGYVGKPVPGLEYGVLCFDFASLYPTLIMGYNISWDTFIPRQNWGEFNDDDCHIIHCDLSKIHEDTPDDEDDEILDEEMEFDDEGNMVSHSRKKKVMGNKGNNVLEVRFLKQYKRDKDGKIIPEPGRPRRDGFLPRMVRSLVDERNYVRKVMMPQYTDPVILNVLEELQKALKVSANSGYGILGVKNGALLPLLEGSIAVTYLGRESIKKTARIMIGEEGDVLKKTADALRDKYPDIDECLARSKWVYTDTDSTFTTHGIPDDMVKLLDVAKEIERHVNGLAPDGKPYFPHPMKLEFEKYFKVLFLIKPKMYVGVLCALKDSRDGKVKRAQPLWDPRDWFVKGVLIIRRDNSNFVRNLFQSVLGCILNERSWEECAYIISDELKKLVNGEIPEVDLVETRSIGKNYKPNSTYFMKLASDNLARLGHPLQAGDRIGYVIVNDPNAPNRKLGYKIRPVEYRAQQKKDGVAEEIDYRYYMTNRCQSRIDDLFKIAYGNKTDFIPVKDFILNGPLPEGEDDEDLDDDWKTLSG